MGLGTESSKIPLQSKRKESRERESVNQVPPAQDGFSKYW